MGRLIGKFQLSFLLIFLLAINVNAGGAIAGKITILKGKVFFERGGQKIQIKKDDTVLESDIIEAEAGTARITMIDSNLVDIYPKTKIEIAKYIYKPNKDQKEVELKVDFGKIKSTVIQKYDGAKNKFQIKTPSAVAGVRGTVFTAEYDRIQKVSKVITIEGLVAVAKIFEGEKQSAPVFVRPNQVVKVDVEQSKAEQPRELTPEERDSRKKEDKDLGYQYDPKNEPTPESNNGGQQPPPSNSNNQPPLPPIVSAGEGQPQTAPETSTQSNGNGSRPDAPPKSANREAQPKELAREIKERVKEVKEIKEIKEIKAVKEIKEIKEVKPVKEIKEIKEVKVREIREIKEPVREIKETATAAANNSSERQQQQQQAQERRQKQAEEDQSKKQKQLEDEQSKKQKQLEEEQAKKQKHAEEEMKKRQQSEMQRADAAKRLAENIKRSENTIINRPPSGIGTTLPSPGGTTAP